MPLKYIKNGEKFYTNDGVEHTSLESVIRHLIDNRPIYGYEWIGRGYGCTYRGEGSLELCLKHRDMLIKDFGYKQESKAVLRKDGQLMLTLVPLYS